MGRRRTQENVSRRKKVLQLDTKRSVPTKTNALSGLVGQYEGSDDEDQPPLPDNSHQEDGGMDTKLADFLAEIDALDSESPRQAETGNTEEKTEAAGDDDEVPEDSKDNAPEAPEWHEILDPNTNCYYYWNSRTQEVTWEIPEVLKNPPPPPPPDLPAEREPTLLEKLTKQEPETGQAEKDDKEEGKEKKDGSESESGGSETAPREDLDARIAGIVGYGSPGIVGYGSGEEGTSNDENKVAEMDNKETEKKVSGDEDVGKGINGEEPDVGNDQEKSEEEIGTNHKKSESGDEGGLDKERRASDDDDDGQEDRTSRERKVSEAKSLGEEEDDDDDLSRYQLFDDDDEDELDRDKDKDDVSGDEKDHADDKTKEDEREEDERKSDSDDDESDRESDHGRKDSGSDDSADVNSGNESDSREKSEEDRKESEGSSDEADDLEDIDKQLEAELEQKKAELRNLELMDTQDDDSKEPVTVTETAQETPDEISSADEGDEDSDILQLESDLKRKLEELGGIEGDKEVKDATKRKIDDVDEEIIDVDKLDDIPPKRRKTSDLVEMVEVGIQRDPESLEAATSTKKIKEEEDMKTKITDLASTLTNKLQFLGISKRGLTKFQLLLLSMETRIQDWRDGHMESVHLLRKLETTDWELERYESEAAPRGWSCHWDRNHKQYYYMNQSTGESQWEYPIEAMLQEQERIGVTGNEDTQAAFNRASSIEGAVDTSDITTTVVEKKEEEVKEAVSKKTKKGKTKVKKKVKKEAPPVVVKAEQPAAEVAPPPIPAVEVAPPPIPALEVLATAPPPPPEPEVVTEPPPPPPPLEPYPPPPPDEPPPPGTEVEAPAPPPLPLTPPPPPPDEGASAPPLPPMSPPPLPPAMEEQLSSLVAPPPPPAPPQEESEDPETPPKLEPAVEPVPEEEDEPPELPMEPPQEPSQTASTAIIGAPQIIYNQAEVSSSPQLYGAPPLPASLNDGVDIDGEPMEEGTASPVISAQPTAAKAKTKIKKTKTGKTKKTKKVKDKKLLAKKKIPHSLVQKWTQIKQEQAKEEEGSSSEEEDQAVVAQRRIEEWKKDQLEKGKAQYNSNFEAIRGDWRERVKKKKGV